MIKETKDRILLIQKSLFLLVEGHAQCYVGGSHDRLYFFLYHCACGYRRPL